MITIDTSALISILQNEPPAAVCMQAIDRHKRRCISAGTVAEALIVAIRRKIEPEMTALIDGLDLEVIPVTATNARKVALAYQRWGKGMHPAKLNYGDCFAYALAQEKQCPLLYVGNDFVQTDITSALPFPHLREET